MSIDAMHWVWNHSQSKGTARHCLLALADKAPGIECTAAMGTTEFIQRSNAARSAVIKAVDQLLASGELTVVEPARGSRPALYKLPLAVGYVRLKPGARGPESGPVAKTLGVRNQDRGGPESGPQGVRNQDPSTKPLPPKVDRSIERPPSVPSSPPSPTTSSGK